MKLFDKALCFATEKHSGQVRKTSNVPYIIHPVEVASIIATMSEDEELLVAGLLHDTIEDTNTTLAEIRQNFGKRVALLVMTETEDKREDLPPEETWMLRKEESLVMLENTKDLDVKMLWMGDKLSNMRSIARDYAISGDAMWEKFHEKDPKVQAWYYGSIAKYLSVLKEYPVYQEYLSLVKYVFKNHLGELANEI